MCEGLQLKNWKKYIVQTIAFSSMKTMEARISTEIHSIWAIFPWFWMFQVVEISVASFPSPCWIGINLYLLQGAAPLLPRLHNCEILFAQLQFICIGSKTLHCLCCFLLHELLVKALFLVILALTLYSHMEFGESVDFHINITVDCVK